jgi:hypothetical protein
LFVSLDEAAMATKAIIILFVIMTLVWLACECRCVVRQDVWY